MIAVNQPAFPEVCRDGEMGLGGLSAREYFACHLFAGILAAKPEKELFERDAPFLAKLARASVSAADALIDALNQQPSAEAAPIAAHQE
ncbi:MAG TPA: hypothetical protein VMG10_10705 [Gemmataceae bacterium]|nr:hypothetical protein [Gemmataceae bacterium]